MNVHQQRRATRVRRIGACLLAACVCVAMFVYRIGVANHVATTAELLPDTWRVVERQRGILFGPMGVEMFRVFEALQEPAGEAGLLVVAGVIGAAACHQLARRIEAGEEQRG